MVPRSWRVLSTSAKSAHVRAPPVIANYEPRVDELYVVGLQHRADLGQPVDQTPVDLVFAQEESGLDRAGRQREDKRSVGVRKQADV